MKLRIANKAILLQIKQQLERGDVYRYCSKSLMPFKTFGYQPLTGTGGSRKTGNT